MSGEARMLTRVARMYHEEGLPQREIALRLSLSQSRVSRMLRKAVQAGIVRTVVVAPPEVHAGLEDALRGAYGLRDAIVVDDASPPALGAATAAYLDATVAAGERIGIASWSATLMAAADAMSAPVASTASEVTQLVGGIGDPAVQFRATGLTARLAELTGRAGGSAARAGSAAQRGAARRAGPRSGRGGRDGRLGRADAGAGRHRRAGAVGAARAERQRDLRLRGRGPARPRGGGRHLLPLLRRGRAGRESELDARVLGIAPDRLQAIPRRIGVAGGAQKYPAVRAALRGGWINVLITDAASAQRLAEERP